MKKLFRELSPEKLLFGSFHHAQSFIEEKYEKVQKNK